jgi:LacI family transcriptional regulator
MAESLGYRPNRVARALITGRTHNIGLIVSDISNPFFPPLIKAAETRARHRDHQVFIADTDEDPATEDELIQALAQQVDGIVLCSPRMSNDLIARHSQEVPLVVVNRIVTAVPAVVMDVASGARDAVEHLVALGHRHLVLIAGPVGSWTDGEIRRAVVAAAAGAGVDVKILGPNQPTEAAGAAVADDLRRSQATGVLAYNDLMAIGLLERQHDRGVAVPEEISVIGIDDISGSRLMRPKLTTVATPTAAAGAAAVDLLLGQNAPAPGGPGGPGDHSGGTDPDATLGGIDPVVLPTELIVRDSTGPCPSPT